MKSTGQSSRESLALWQLLVETIIIFLVCQRLVENNVVFSLFSDLTTRFIKRDQFRLFHWLKLPWQQYVRAFPARRSHQGRGVGHGGNSIPFWQPIGANQRSSSLGLTDRELILSESGLRCHAWIGGRSEHSNLLIPAKSGDLTMKT